MSKKYKIVVTGGSGRFGKKLKSLNNAIYLFPNKKELDILNLNRIIKYLKKNKPKILVHLAGFSRPMRDHEKKIEKSINLNIIGTSNITIACKKLKWDECGLNFKQSIIKYFKCFNLLKSFKCIPLVSLI